MERERKSSCTQAASSRRLASSSTVDEKPHENAAHTGCIQNTTYIILSLHWSSAATAGSANARRKNTFRFHFPSVTFSAALLVQSYYLRRRSGVTDTCGILISWSGILEILVPDNTLNQTVTQGSRLTLRAPPQRHDLWSITLISNNFLQRTDTSVICHKGCDVSEGKRLFFRADGFFWPLLRLRLTWYTENSRPQSRVNFSKRIWILILCWAAKSLSPVPSLWETAPSVVNRRCTTEGTTIRAKQWSVSFIKNQVADSFCALFWLSSNFSSDGVSDKVWSLATDREPWHFHSSPNLLWLDWVSVCLIRPAQ